MWLHCNQVDNGANSITGPLYVTWYVGCYKHWLWCTQGHDSLRWLTNWWLTQDVVGAGRVKGDVDCRDVVVVVTEVASAQPLPRQVAPHNVLITLVSSLRTLVCNEKMMKTMIGDRFLLIDTTQRMSYTVASCWPCHEARPVSNEARVIFSPPGRQDTRNHYHQSGGWLFHRF